MFASAYSTAIKFTRPIITVIRLQDGSVSAGIATFIVLNKDGWILTAAHVLAPMFKAQNDARERAEYETKKQQIESDPSTSPGVKRHRLRELVKKPDWITHSSFITGDQGSRLSGKAFADGTADIAVAQLTNIQSLKITEFPKFARPETDITPGTSLCTLGFPFQSVSARFDEATQRFDLGKLPSMVFFPTEGIHTRNAITADAQTGRQVKFIETSSPGLKGQSGGPIFDVHGNVWALQSRTTAYPLGIAPPVKDGHKEFTVPQFIQVGHGCHASHIRDFLTANSVVFDVAP